MADNILKGKIQIEAASGTRQNLEILTNQLVRLQRIASSGDLGFKQFERVNALIGKTQAQINSFSRNTSNAFNGVTQGSNTATQSLINLSRVAQDAPFGFIGIANNLNPLLESFQRLRAEAGSNKAALSSLAASLSGPAGIGLALGVVSSLLITFGDKLFGSSTEVNKFDIELETLNSTLKETAKRIDAVKDGLDFANQLGSINIEIAGLGKSVDFSGQVIATRDAIEKLVPEVQNLLEKRLDLQSQLETAPGKDLSTKQIESIKKQFDAVDQEYDKAFNSLKELRNRETVLQRNVTAARQKEAADALKQQEEAAEKADAARKKALEALRRRLEEEQKLRLDHLKTLLTTNIEFTPVVDFVKNQNEAEKAIEESGKEFEELATRHLKNQKIAPHINIVPSVDINAEKVLKGIDDMADPIKAQVNNLVDAIIRSLATDLLAGLGEAFAAFATGGGLSDVFKSLGNQIGSALQNLGKQMIALSPVIAALKIAIKTLNPAILLPAGIGLVAIGSIIKSSLGKLPGFAQGGVVPPGYPNDTFLARLTSGERIIPAGQSVQPAFARASGGDRIIMHEVRGDSLRLWIANANKMGGLW